MLGASSDAPARRLGRPGMSRVSGPRSQVLSVYIPLVGERPKLSCALCGPFPGVGKVLGTRHVLVNLLAKRALERALKNRSHK